MAGVLRAMFAHVPVRYTINDTEDANPAFDYSGMEKVGADEVKNGTSWLDTPINFKFGFAAGTYNYFSGGKIEKRKVEAFQMPLPTMVSVSRSKRDKITPVSAGDESVIEMYAFNLWEVRIQGVCVYDPSHPQAKEPADQRKLLANLENAADSLELEKADGLFTDLGIYNLYIRSIHFGQLVGKPNMLPFEMTCLSDKPLELRTA
jgi:hypothetical protein